MSFLSIDNEQVVVLPEAMLLDSVKRLHCMDHHTGKPWFSACCKYTYFMYKKGGIFQNMLPEQRATRICSEILKGKYEPKEFELNSACKEMIGEYLRLQYTPNELLYEGIKSDIEGLLQRIRQIPFVRKEWHEVNAELPDQEGILSKQRVKVLVEMDNSEEKNKAIRLADSLLDYEAKLRSKISQETKEDRKKKSSKRLFEI
jgi:hypothetical protein